jgi:hypothetical protein
LAAQGDQAAAATFAIMACAPFEEFPNRRPAAPLDLAHFQQTLGQALAGEAWRKETACRKALPRRSPRWQQNSPRNPKGSSMTANHIARMTAKRLMPKFGDNLPLTVEQVIQSAPAQPGQFIYFGTQAAISALIVQCARLAFDLKRSNGGGENLDKEALRRELRRELGLPEGVGEKTRDEVIEAAAEETEAEE